MVTDPPGRTTNHPIAYLVPLSTSAEEAVRHPRNRDFVEYQRATRLAFGQQNDPPNLVIEINLAYLLGRSCFSIGASRRRAFYIPDAPDVPDHILNLSFNGKLTCSPTHDSSITVRKPRSAHVTRVPLHARAAESLIISFGTCDRFEFLLCPVDRPARQTRTLLNSYRKAMLAMKSVEQDSLPELKLPAEWHQGLKTQLALGFDDTDNRDYPAFKKWPYPITMSNATLDVYSVEQVEAWLEHIGLSRDFRPDHTPGEDLIALAKIQRYHLCKVPFEDLELHYSNHHSITLDPQQLFNRVVMRGMGGYCMQGNTFLEHMLRALGFTLYSAGARSRPRKNGIPQGPWTGWTHQVVIATLADGNKYMVDVAYGGDCPIRPLKLEEGIETRNIAQHNRLVQEALGHDKSQKTWVYQIQYEPGGDWYGGFCFTESEFLPQDFGVISHFTSTNPISWLSNTVMGVRFIQEKDEIVGKYTLAHHVFKRNLRGEVKVVLECHTEQERVEGLEKYLGVKLNDEEKGAIKGWVAELRDYQ